MGQAETSREDLEKARSMIMDRLGRKKPLSQAEENSINPMVDILVEQGLLTANQAGGIIVTTGGWVQRADQAVQLKSLRKPAE